jgi:gluconolactonase
MARRDRCFAARNFLFQVRDTHFQLVRGKRGNILAQLTGTGDGGPDGMKVDRDNNLYCCGPGGLHVLTADGHSLGVIKTPEALANFTWGDEDMQSIFLTASTSL